MPASEPADLGSANSGKVYRSVEWREPVRVTNLPFVGRIVAGNLTSDFSFASISVIRRGVSDHGGNSLSMKASVSPHLITLSTPKATADEQL